MIPVNRPDISGEDIEQYFRFKYSDFPEGMYVKKLEDYFASLFGEEYHAVFTASAKVSLYLLFKVLGTQGNVLTSPLTCFSALTPLVANGIKPRYVDIDSDSFLMNEALIEEKVDSQSAAILAIALGGCPGQLDRIKEISRKRKLLLIEDCAQALGSTYNNKLLGAYGDFSFFSFTKHLSMVGGGMLLSKKKEVIEQVKRVQNQFPKTPDGLLDYRLKRDLIELNLNDAYVEKTYKKLFLNADVKYKETDPDTVFDRKGVLCQPNELQGAMIFYQLQKLDGLIERRRKNVSALKDRLGKVTEIKFQKDLGKSSYAKLYAVTPYENRGLIAYMFENGVDCKQLTKSHGVYLQKRIDKTRFLKNSSIRSCSEYFKIHDHIIELPLSSNMSSNELERIKSSIIQVSGGNIQQHH